LRKDINLLDPDTFIEGVPYEWFAYLRHHAPVYRHPLANGRGPWIITRYRDLVEVSRDAQNYSLEGGGDGSSASKPERGLLKTVRTILIKDPRYRNAVNRGFTARLINLLEPEIREIVGAILDRAIAKGACDLVPEVASEVPAQVVGAMLGIPAKDRRKLLEWSNCLLGSSDPEYAVDEKVANAGALKMYVYLKALAAQRAKEPRDDFISAMVNAVSEGERSSQIDINLIFMLVAVSGNETTRNALSHSVNALIENPDQFARLAERPELAASATEEILRRHSPVMHFTRHVLRDTTLRGEQIRAGDKVAIWYVSANRDEEIFDDPASFDIARTPNEHVAFGAGGQYFCLGANLARLEMRVFLEELVNRVARIERIGPMTRLRSSFINGIKHLPVRLIRKSRA
jgi:cholest-4-en-3-one 26-monooxygenase